MSTSVAIPARKATASRATGDNSYSSSSSSSWSSPRSSSFPNTPSSTSTSKAKGKAPVTDSSPVEKIAPRRPSLMGSSLSKSEYTVVNLAHSDGPPRLVTCVKSSQGWNWNQELFLPSYANHDGHDLENRPDPIEEIVLTDEEAAAMLPS